MKSYPKPTDDIINQALKKLTSIQLRRRFFEKLDNPHWVKPLSEKEWFSKAPDLLREGDTIRFLDWPELEYLSRMVEAVPNDVFEVISRIKETENYFIQMKALEAALRLPTDLASKFVHETVMGWFPGNTRVSSFVVDGLVALCNKLAATGDEAAFDIADKLLLSFYKDESETFDKIKPKIWQDWNFKESTKKIEASMTNGFGIRYLQLLSRKLKNVLVLEKGVDQDRSSWWRSAVEEHEQDKYKDKVKGRLVDTVRNVALALLPQDRDQVFETLKNFELFIFRRIEIYLSGTTGTKVSEQVERFFKSPDFFWEIDYNHEIYHFLKQQFINLSKAEKEQILNLIFRGPPDGKDVESEKFRKYDPIKEHLSGQYQEDFKKTYGTDHPDFTIYSEGVWSGPTSPLSGEEVSKYTVVDLVKFVQGWKPVDSWRQPTPRGLGRTIEADFKKSPEKYLEHLTLFQIEQPTYVGHVLTALGGIDDKFFNKEVWNDILSLCEWLVDRPVKIEGREIKDNFNDDPDWQWSRHRVVSLLHSKMRSSPVGYRERIWRLIYTISEDNDPTREDEEKAFAGNNDAYGYAINTTKGEALHAAIEYGLWLHELDKTIQTPELLALLDKIARRDFDGLFIQRSVFGRFFPWLHLLFLDWARENKSNIFPKDNLRKFFAAWEPYISYCNPYTDMFPILEDEYLFSLSNQSTDEDDSYNYYERLASHVVVFFLRGKIEKDSAIMKKLFSGKTEKPVFSYLGRCLQDKDIPNEEVKKIQEIWDDYLNERVKGKPISDEQKSILSHFSYWIEAESLDVDWMLQNLEYLLSLKVKLKDAIGVCEGLAQAAKTRPLKALNLLKEVIAVGAIDYFVTMHREEIEKMLQIGHSSTDAEVKKAASRVVHALGERGYRGYEKYL